MTNHVGEGWINNSTGETTQVTHYDPQTKIVTLGNGQAVGYPPVGYTLNPTHDETATARLAARITDLEGRLATAGIP